MYTEKKCFKCGEIKPLEEFYKHSEMKDGHLNKCKVCAIKDSKTKDPVLWEKRKERDRNRKNKEHRNEQKKTRMKYLREHEPEKYKEIMKKKNEYNRNNRFKRNVNLKTRRAIQSGILIKPKACEKCQEIRTIQAHHEDYSKPLDVMWLCTKCHGRRHAELNEIKRKKIREDKNLNNFKQSTNINKSFAADK